MTEPTDAPLIGVLALQGDVREHLTALESVGARTTRVRRASELARIDGLVIPGGESSTIDRLLRVFDLMDPLRAAVHAGLPTYGSCAGMILLADDVPNAIDGQQTIGGLDVVVRRNAFGRQVDSFEAPVHVADIGAPDFHAVFIRAPWVEAVGPGVEVLGVVGDGPATGRIVAVRQGHLLATSFHPELTGDARLHGLFVDLVRARATRTTGKTSTTRGDL